MPSTIFFHLQCIEHCSSLSKQSCSTSLRAFACQHSQLPWSCQGSSVPSATACGTLLGQSMSPALQVHVQMKWLWTWYNPRAKSRQNSAIHLQPCRFARICLHAPGTRTAVLAPKTCDSLLDPQGAATVRAREPGCRLS